MAAFFTSSSEAAEWLVDDARKQLETLDVEQHALRDGMVHETDRPRAIKFLADQIQKIHRMKPKGLWDYADKLRRLEADFEALWKRNNRDRAGFRHAKHWLRSTRSHWRAVRYINRNTPSRTRGPHLLRRIHLLLYSG